MVVVGNQKPIRQKRAERLTLRYNQHRRRASLENRRHTLKPFAEKQRRKAEHQHRTRIRQHLPAKEADAVGALEEEPDVPPRPHRALHHTLTSLPQSIKKLHSGMHLDKTCRNLESLRLDNVRRKPINSCG